MKDIDKQYLEGDVMPEHLEKETQTEELRAVIEGYLNSPVNFSKPTHILSRQILKACKESGLKFTRTGMRGDDVEGSCLCQVEEIEID